MKPSHWRALIVVLTCAAAGMIRVAAAPQQAPLPQPATEVALSQRALIDRYCVTCHSARAKSGGLVLENADLSAVGAHGEMWEKVVRKLRAGMMPPPGMPSPAAPDKQSLVTWLE